jgi:hypothetical protein
MAVERHPNFDNVLLMPGVTVADLESNLNALLPVLDSPDSTVSFREQPSVATQPKPMARLPYERERWKDYRKCEGQQDLFWSSKPKDVKAAIQICTSCIARVECLEDALQRDDLGVQGGMKQKDRRRIREQRRIHNS